MKKWFSVKNTTGEDLDKQSVFSNEKQKCYRFRNFRAFTKSILF
jgi:hypothetical protein